MGSEDGPRGGPGESLAGDLIGSPPNAILRNPDRPSTQRAVPAALSEPKTEGIAPVSGRLMISSRSSRSLSSITPRTLQLERRA